MRPAEGRPKASSAPLRRRRRRGGESGSASVELVLVAPVVVAIVLLLVAGGRLAMTGLGVESAAASAARAVSLQPSSLTATDVAVATATRSLTDRGVPCTSVSVTVDAIALDAMLGVRGTVSVTVQCTVPLADVALPGLPGVRTMTSTASSPVDAYRARG